MCAHCLWGDAPREQPCKVALCSRTLMPLRVCSDLYRAVQTRLFHSALAFSPRSGFNPCLISLPQCRVLSCWECCSTYDVQTPPKAYSLHISDSRKMLFRQTATKFDTLGGGELLLLLPLAAHRALQLLALRATPWHCLG